MQEPFLQALLDTALVANLVSDPALVVVSNRHQDCFASQGKKRFVVEPHPAGRTSVQIRKTEFENFDSISKSLQTLRGCQSL